MKKKQMAGFTGSRTSRQIVGWKAWVIYFVSFLLHGIGQGLFGQPYDSLFRTELEKQVNSSKSGIIREPALLKEFYGKKGFRPVWFGRPTDNIRRQDALRMINEAGKYALISSEFHYSELQNYFNSRKKLKGTSDSLRAEILWSDALLSMLRRIAYGDKPSLFRYNGLSYKANCIDIPGMLLQGLELGNIQPLISLLEPKNPFYKALVAEYRRLDSIQKQPGFSEIRVHSRRPGYDNKPLVEKLIQLGYLHTGDTSTSGLKNALYDFQKKHNLPVQESIHTGCLNTLNEKLVDKMKELAWNIGWYRWLSCMDARSFILVNIPAGKLYYFRSGVVKLQCRMVVGKLITQSPTLSSLVKNVIYYPYWNVPHSIATKEMLPDLKRNRSYLKAMNLEVLQNGKVIDPSGINWNAYSRGYFPYSLRQLPGCDNALGLLKFEFDNPFHVYLHDTNVKKAFDARNRFFSHGCMRVEKPFELADWLGVPPDRIRGDTCETGRKPEIFPLENPVPVFVIYATMDVSEGNIFWFEDPYRKLSK